MALDPKAQALLDMIYRVGAPRFHELDTHQARRSFEKLQGAFGVDKLPVASVTEVPIPVGGDSGRVIMARLYRPLSSSSAQPLPVALSRWGLVHRRCGELRRAMPRTVQSR